MYFKLCFSVHHQNRKEICAYLKYVISVILNIYILGFKIMEFLEL